MFNLFPSPFSGQNREHFTKSEYGQAIFGVLFFVTIIFLYAFEFKHISNTFSVEKLMVRSLGAGALIGGILAYFFSKKNNDPLEKMKTYVLFVLLTMLIFPLFGSLTNRLFSNSPSEKVEVEFEKQSAYIKSRFGKVQSKEDGHFVFFVKNRKLERIKTKEVLFPDAQKGDRILITTKKGFWGFEYFLE